MRLLHQHHRQVDKNTMIPNTSKLYERDFHFVFTSASGVLTHCTHINNEQCNMLVIVLKLKLVCIIVHVVQYTICIICNVCRGEGEVLLALADDGAAWAWAWARPGARHSIFCGDGVGLHSTRSRPSSLSLAVAAAVNPAGQCTHGRPGVPQYVQQQSSSPYDEFLFWFPVSGIFGSKNTPNNISTTSSISKIQGEQTFLKHDHIF